MTLAMEGITDPEVVEAIACREVAAARDLLIQRFRLASDCETVIRSLQGHIVQEISRRRRKVSRRWSSCMKVVNPMLTVAKFFPLVPNPPI
jgi:hypothetical protein